ncbi:MAG TPA: sigma-70 family RNA polymerase sigma factor [Longimicrobiales bacterium]|nr:sigma-70 family RNA polymerase sigma factor [Longimicrobiales bacterium]
MSPDSERESALVAAAAGGSHEAFRRLVEPLGQELHLFCYRMLGSFHDAEDVLQEARLKAWKGLGRFDGRASFRTWMYRIATNAALDALKSRRRRVVPQDLVEARDPSRGLGEPRHDIPWLEPYPDAHLPSTPHDAVELRESVRLAFIRALQMLPPRQRAILILRDVLDWSAAEVADGLDTSVAAVNSALQRARATVRDHSPRDPLPGSGGELERRKAELMERYVAAWEAGDVDAVVAMLTDDATHAMPPWAAWFAGRTALRSLYSAYPVWGGGPPRPGLFRVVPFDMNGEPGFAEYCRTDPEGPYHALALTVATVNPGGTLMAAKTSFVDAALFAPFGLPETLQEAPA